MTDEDRTPVTQPDYTDNVLSMVKESYEADFDGLVTAYTILAAVMDSSGGRDIRIISSPHSSWWEDRGMLEAALDEYRGIGLAMTLRGEED